MKAAVRSEQRARSLLTPTRWIRHPRRMLHVELTGVCQVLLVFLVMFCLTRIRDVLLLLGGQYGVKMLYSEPGRGGPGSDVAGRTDLR